MELNLQEKMEIVKAKIRQYQANLYSLKLDYRVMEVLEDKARIAQVEQAVKQQLQAIEFLESELDALELHP